MLRTLIVCACVAVTQTPSHAQMVDYYVGIDSRATIPSGTYAGLPNPNLNKLTFLKAHEHTPASDSHFHAKGVYSYTGPNLGAATAVNPTNASNFLPEDSSRIQLMPGSGPLADRFVSGMTPGVEYSNLNIQTVNNLSGFPAGTVENYVFNSGGGRFTTLLSTGHALQLNLVSISPGFEVIDAATGNTLLSTPGQTLALGDAASLSATLTFATSTADAIGSLRFTISDTAGVDPYPTSGEFVFNVQSVPEPGSMALLGVTAIGWAGWRRWKRIG